MTPQECRAAHGPRHPAMTSPLRLCSVCGFSVSGQTGVCSCICAVILSRGPVVCLQLCPLRLDLFLIICLRLSLFSLFRQLCPLRLDLFLIICLRLSLLSVSVVCCRRCFFLFLFSQVLGKCKPPRFAFPLVTLHPGHGLRLQPVLRRPHFPKVPAPRVFNGLSGCLVCVFPPCFLPLGLEERKIRLTGAHGTMIFSGTKFFSLSFRLADAAFLVYCFTPL